MKNTISIVFAVSASFFLNSENGSLMAAGNNNATEGVKVPIFWMGSKDPHKELASLQGKLNRTPASKATEREELQRKIEVVRKEITGSKSKSQTKCQPTQQTPAQHQSIYTTSAQAQPQTIVIERKKRTEN